MFGVLIGTVMIGAVGGFELIVGAVRLNLRSGLNFTLLARNLGLSLLFFAYFAAGEELLFRGYPYQALIEGMGTIGSTIFMAVMFGALHVFNPNASAISTINTMLAGAWLSVAYLKKRTLLLSFRNALRLEFCTKLYPFSSRERTTHEQDIFVPTDYGPYWLTGGRYGPEAGVCTTVVLILAILYFIIDKRIKPAYDFASYKERLTARVESRVSV